jgi:hypothetical protein
MKSRYRLIEEQSYEACLEKAKAVFGVEEQDIYRELFSDGNVGGVWKLLAARKDEADENGDRDGEIFLNYEVDGVYIEIIPAGGSGAEANPDAFRAYLKRKNIREMVLCRWRRHWGRAAAI